MLKTPYLIQQMKGVVKVSKYPGPSSEKHQPYNDIFLQEGVVLCRTDALTYSPDYDHSRNNSRSPSLGTLWLPGDAPADYQTLCDGLKPYPRQTKNDLAGKFRNREALIDFWVKKLQPLPDLFCLVIDKNSYKVIFLKPYDPPTSDPVSNSPVSGEPAVAQEAVEVFAPFNDGLDL